MKHAMKKMLAIIIAVMLALPGMLPAVAEDDPPEGEPADVVILDEFDGDEGGDEGAGEVWGDISFEVEEPEGDGEQEPPQYEPAPATVYLITEDYALIDTLEVKDGEALARPEDPAAPEGMAFEGWYDADGNRLFADGDAEVIRLDGATEINFFARFVEAPGEPSPDASAEAGEGGASAPDEVVSPSTPGEPSPLGEGGASAPEEVVSPSTPADDETKEGTKDETQEETTSPDTADAVSPSPKGEGSEDADTSDGDTTDGELLPTDELTDEELAALDDPDADPEADPDAEGELADGEEESPDAQRTGAAVEGAEGEGAEADPDYPAFEQSENVDGVVVTVKAEAGVFPAGAALSVEAVPAAKVEDAVDEARDDDQNVAASYTFDIKVIDPETGEEYQPNPGQTVSVSFALAQVADENLTTSVYHIDDSGSAEKLDVTQEDGTTATVETDGFSLYTVEFTYNSLEYVLQGGGSVALAEILESVGLTGEVEAVAVSDASLFDAVLKDGAWVVESYRAFDSEEWMKVTINAQAYEIAVTDDQAITYLDENGQELPCTEYNFVRSDSTSWSDGWYAVTENTTIESRVTVTGTVNLILCDGATLKVNDGGIEVLDGNSLTIWAQSRGAGMGALEAKGSGNAAGIGGGGAGGAGGNITINGGKVTATGGGYGGAGIGGGDGGEGGTITINGGKVTANGGKFGAGIGGGAGGAGGNITISGGEVTANGGEWGAGIGGGLEGAGTSESGNITISGGEVEATGKDGGAGIGGGLEGAGTSDNGKINITGGEVTANGGEWGAGIGGGLEGAGGNLELGYTETSKTSMRVKASSYKYSNVKIDNGQPFIAEDGTTVNTQSDLRLADGKWIFPKVDDTVIVDYVDANNKPMGKRACVEVTYQTKTWGTGGKTTWYAVNEDQEFDCDRIIVTGHVNLILCDGETLDVPYGITVSEGNSLTVWAQSGGTGALIAGKRGDAVACLNNCAGIGGDNGAGGNITINGGKVTANGGTLGAGIGGGDGGDGGTIHINGGKVTATGNGGGAGIGVGIGGDGGTIHINGGKVTATGNGGGAGIGGSNGTLRLDLSNAEADAFLKASSYGCTVNVADKDNNPVYVKDENVNIYTGAISNTGPLNNRELVNVPVPPVDYLNEKGETKTCSNYRPVGANTPSWGTVNQTIWYAVTEDVTISSRVEVTGDVNLILCDGAMLTAPYGITVSEGNSLTVWAQSIGATKGALVSGVSKTIADNNAGIGGGDYGDGGTIQITGGTVTAKGGDFGAGIGGSYCGKGGTIQITGGEVEANGGEYGAGIGGGYYGTGGNITISGGTVTATGSVYGAGIGGGGDAGTSDNGNITIRGGTVTATGSVYGAGIGGGKNGAGGKITITGGKVEAKIDSSGNGAGIGGGDGGAGGTLRLDLSGAAADDYLKASSYNCTVNVEDASGKPVYVTDGSRFYTGELTEVEKNNVASKELKKAAPTPWQKLQTAIHKADTGTDTTTIKVSEFADEEGKLTAEATDVALVIAAGQNITLDLDGCTLDRHLTVAASNGNVITVNGSLTLTDSSENKAGTITGGNNTSNTGGVLVNDGATFTMTGGTISGNTASIDGGGVYVYGGTFTMDNGTISGNTAGRDGGGVYVFSGGTFNLSGAPVISGNRKGATVTDSGLEDGTDNNVYLPTGRTIAVTGELTNTTPIGITMQTPGDITSGAAFKDRDAARQRFTTDGTAKNEVNRSSGGQATLYVAEVEAGDHSIQSFATLEGIEGAVAALNDTTGATLRLLTDVTTASTLSTSGSNNTLDLNGYGIRMTGSGSVIKVQAGVRNLTLTDSDPNRTHYITLDDDGRGTAVSDKEPTSGEYVKVTGGYITGGKATNGGVCVENDVFTMTGGTITGNTATQNGGGVYLSGGTFSLSGKPTVTGNTGGNVYLPDGRTIAIDGALSDGASVGITMAKPGVFTDGYGFEDGGYNKVKYPESYFFADDVNRAVGLVSSGNKLEAALLCPWQKLQSEINYKQAEGGAVNIQLTADVTADSIADGDDHDDVALVVPAGKTVILDLNGHKIDRALTDAADNGNVITVNGSLTVKDTAGGGTITGGNNTGDGGGAFVAEGGALTLASGAISGNGANYGGGVYAAGALQMTGGEIGGNGVVNCGGGLYVGAKGSAALTGGSITGNGTEKSGNGMNGGGVYVAEGGAVEMSGKAAITGNLLGGAGNFYGGGVYCEGTFDMKGGEISGNRATGGDYGAGHGGGVSVGGKGVFTVTGGKITGNEASYGSGGGAFVSGGAFDMKGGEISGNKASEDGGGAYLSGGTFSLSGGAITGNETKARGGGVYCKGVFDMQGGQISGNRASEGGGVCVYNRGALNMTGGSITGNAAGEDACGGGVYVYEDGALSVSGAVKITGNTEGTANANNVYLKEDTVVTVAGKLDGAAIGVTTEAKPGEDGADFVTITGSLKGNGELTAFTSDDSAYAVGWNAEGTEAVLGRTIAHSAEGYSGKYDGKTHGIAVKVTVPASGATVSYGDGGNAFVNVGEYTVAYTVKAAGYFPVSDSRTVKITPAALTVAAKDASKTYGEADPELTYTATGLVGGDKLTGSLAREAGEDAGTYKITQGTLKATDNYAMAFTGATLTIAPKAVAAATVVLSETEYTADGTAKEPGVTVKDGDTVIPATEYTVSYSDNVQPGTATVTITDKAGGNYVVSGSATFTIKAKPEPEPEPKPRPAPKGTLIATLKSTGSKSLQGTWTELENVDGYDVFFAKCNGGKEKFELIGSVKAGEDRSVKIKDLSRKTIYQIYVRAWVKEGKEKVYVGKESNSAHAMTGDYNKVRTNAKSISVDKKKVKLGEGQTAKIKGTVKGVNTSGKRKVIGHAGKVRYISSNSAVAEVSSSGKITGKRAGNCTIYVLASNGIYKTVKVTVKPGPETLAFGADGYSVKQGKTLSLKGKLAVTPDKVTTTYTWKSSNKKIATVDKSGKVKGVKKGTVTITVKSSNGKAAKVNVTVK